MTGLQNRYLFWEALYFEFTVTIYIVSIQTLKNSYYSFKRALSYRLILLF